jgi:hypothetical protein
MCNNEEKKALNLLNAGKMHLFYNKELKKSILNGDHIDLLEFG